MNEFSSGTAVKTQVQQHACYQQGNPEWRMNTSSYCTLCMVAVYKRTYL